MTINRDLALALVYLATGVAGLWFGRNLHFGSLAQTGPGTFPTLIAWALVIFGLASMLRGITRPVRTLEVIGWKPLAIVTISIVSFALLLTRIGFLPALTLLGLGAALASRHFALRPLPLVGLLAFVAVCYAIFVVALGLPLPQSGLTLPWIGRI